MDARNARIFRWLDTKGHGFLPNEDISTDDERAVTNNSASLPDGGDDGNASIVSDLTTGGILPESKDILIPKQMEMDMVFQKGQDLWSRLVALARSLPPASLSAGLNDPSITLKDVPALPERLSKRGTLYGRPYWHISAIPTDHNGGELEKDFNLQYVNGTRKEILLSYSKPVECRVSPQVTISNGNSSTAFHNGPYPPGLLLLTLCWSYIFSVRFWELQGKQVVYTSHTLQPQPKRSVHNRSPNLVDIHIGASASERLTRWISALLAPKLGWSVQQGGFAPWTAFCSGGAEFAIITDKLPISTPNCIPPSSDEAVELLVELCCLYGFESDQSHNHRPDRFSPILAAFVAVLALPFYRSLELQPQFLAPTLRLNPTKRPPDSVKQYAADLRYYMTLSISPRSVGSIIWSIFWHPSVKCNVVSHWLGSILHVLRPLIDRGSFDTIAKAFALYRPRVGLWWLGIFLLGSPRISDFIVRYLEKLEERYGYGTMALPDTTVSSWTGSPQSFLDERTSHAYTGLEDLVSNTDLLRCRYNFRLQDSSSGLLSWQPFGDVQKTEIEPDIWPWLECCPTRIYQHWVWYVKSAKNEKRFVRQEIQQGFRKDSGRFVGEVADCLDVMPLDGVVVERSPNVDLEPSREATLRMIAYCMEEMSGDRDAGISTFPGVKTHPWLKGWRGLEA
jgi:hypothetical protein